MKLFVAGLPSDMSSSELQAMFELYGTVLTAKVVTEPGTRKSKGFGFVQYSSVAEAKECIGILDGKKIEGKVLVVKVAEDKS